VHPGSYHQPEAPWERSCGTNASGESELETWHETISGMQERDIRRALENIFKIIQLSEFGEIKRISISSSVHWMS
jgi:hypothetical protein